MIDYRTMDKSDVDAVTAFSLEVLRSELERTDDALHLAPLKVRDCVAFFQQDQRHFHLIAFQDGIVVGAVAAVVSEMPFFERKEASVFMCFAAVPVVLRRLVRALLEWFERESYLRRLAWAQNAGRARFVSFVSRFAPFRRDDMLVWIK